MPPVPGMTNVSFKTEVLTRLGVVEGAIVRLADGMNDLRNNHLHTLSGQVEDLNIKINSNPTWLTTAIISALSSATVGLAVAFIVRR